MEKALAKVVELAPCRSTYAEWAAKKLEKPENNTAQTELTPAGRELVWARVRRHPAGSEAACVDQQESLGVNRRDHRRGDLISDSASGGRWRPARLPSAGGQFDARVCAQLGINRLGSRRWPGPPLSVGRPGSDPAQGGLWSLPDGRELLTTACRASGAAPSGSSEIRPSRQQACPICNRSD